MRVFKNKPTGRPRKGIYKICNNCQKKYYCIQSRIKTAKFCSVSCGLTGENNHKWKNGTLNWAGYRLIMVNGKQVREHRYIVENVLGRKLKKDEDVHHINGIKIDNRLANLCILQRGKHSKLSYKARKINNLGQFT